MKVMRASYATRSGIDVKNLSSASSVQNICWTQKVLLFAVSACGKTWPGHTSEVPGCVKFSALLNTDLVPTHGALLPNLMLRYVTITKRCVTLTYVR